MRPPVLLLFGPTAVGKTAALTALASHPIEVISADSMQVYRGMDIGTAKPDAALLARVPHHLIDIRNPDEQYDVGAFVTDANAAIRAIVGRGRLPVVSGGTAFYFRHLVHGLPEAPASEPAVRDRIRARRDATGLAALFEQLERVDPQTASRVGPHDEYRITRALEVFEQTGRPLSSYRAAGPPRDDVDIRIVELERPRGELARRIEARVHRMFRDGLRGEVERLVGEGYDSRSPGLRAIGYREFFTDDGELRPPEDGEAIAGEIAASTRRYAKRQETFFRSIAGVTRVAADDLGEVLRLTAALLAKLDSP